MHARQRASQLAMKRRVGTAALVGAAALILALVAAGVVQTYLTEHGQRRTTAAVVIALVGAAGGGGVVLLVLKLCRGRLCTILLTAAVVLIVLLPLTSAAYGRITYARFGLTVYGLMPVPTLDITVGPRGGLWFRDKSHTISFDEVRSLVSPQVDVLIIGTGWHGAASVDPAVRDLKGIEVHILRTPDAFRLFNDQRAQGRLVVLLAHTTC